MINSRGKEPSAKYLEEKAEHEAYKAELRAILDARVDGKWSENDRKKYVDLLIKHERISSKWAYLGTGGKIKYSP